MIEIEKKFVISEDIRAKLLDGATLVGKKTFTDVYYDTDTFSLTTKDTWLRARDNKWELKIPLADFLTRTTDQYRELENEKEIAMYLTLNGEKDLATSLNVSGYLPFASITTTRTKLKKGEFSIDLDSTDFGFEIGEIEYMVRDEHQIAQAEANIVAFAKQHGIKISKVKGKILEYLIRNKPDHFNALVSAGVTLPLA